MIAVSLRKLGTTLVHEFHIFYSHAEWNILSSLCDNYNNFLEAVCFLRELGKLIKNTSSPNLDIQTLKRNPEFIQIGYEFVLITSHSRLFDRSEFNTVVHFHFFEQLLYKVTL